MQTAVASEAEKIRKILKDAFPWVKFTVRSKSFSMGSSVHVSWVDFPTEKAVRKVISEFEHVGRDETGEILGGGNRYVICENRWSKDVEAQILEKLPEGIRPDSKYYWMEKVANQMWEEIQNKQEV